MTRRGDGVKEKDFHSNNKMKHVWRILVLQPVSGESERKEDREHQESIRIALFVKCVPTQEIDLVMIHYRGTREKQQALRKQQYSDLAQ